MKSLENILVNIQGDFCVVTVVFFNKMQEIFSLTFVMILSKFRPVQFVWSMFENNIDQMANT